MASWERWRHYLKSFWTSVQMSSSSSLKPSNRLRRRSVRRSQPRENREDLMDSHIRDNLFMWPSRLTQVPPQHSLMGSNRRCSLQLVVEIQASPTMRRRLISTTWTGKIVSACWDYFSPRWTQVCHQTFNTFSNRWIMHVQLPRTAIRVEYSGTHKSATSN